MDPVTHVATGLLFSQLIPTPSRAWGAVAGVIFALLPDLDYLLTAVDRLAFIRYHRGLTHSLMAVPLFALLGAGVGLVLFGPRWFRPLFLLGLATLTCHLLLDLATAYGTQVFSPFTRRKLTLDWLFIIDPYLTLLFATGAAAALFSPGWGRQVGASCLALAGAYFLLCGFYHHQALSLAREVFQEEAQQGATVAALPQPFSCRRWQLLAAGPQGIRQAFVQLPYTAGLGRDPGVKQAQAANIPVGQGCQAPDVPYQPPQDLCVQTWSRAGPAPGGYPPEAQRVLDIYLEFARFPLLHRVERQGDRQLLEWLDLRFTVPGRAYPFVLQLRLDSGGRLLDWVLGPCGGERS